jgi:hemerythrin superfamily protein
MGAFDDIQERIARTAREARERIEDLTESVREAKDRVIGTTHRPQGQGQGKKAGQEEEGQKARGQRETARGIDVLELLKKDHELVNGLFEQLEAIRGEDKGDLREGLFAQLKYELGTHAALEEKLFYPEIRQLNQEKGRDLVQEATREHQEVRLLLSEMAAMPMSGPEWDARLIALREAVQQHVQMEEDEIFSLCRDRLDEAQRRDMGRRAEQEKQALARAGKPDEADEAAALAQPSAGLAEDEGAGEGKAEGEFRTGTASR